VVEPDLTGTVDARADTTPDESLRLDPASVLRLARALNSLPARLLLVGCQPETHGTSDGQVGLSAPVAAAVRAAVRLVESLAADLVRQ
jgi:hydrogenase maturation protease